jgi:hypothetical protein
MLIPSSSTAHRLKSLSLVSFKLTSQLRDPAFDDVDGVEKESLGKLSWPFRAKSQLLLDVVDDGDKVEEDDLLPT